MNILGSDSSRSEPTALRVTMYSLKTCSHSSTIPRRHVRYFAEKWWKQSYFIICTCSEVQLWVWWTEPCFSRPASRPGRPCPQAPVVSEPVCPGSMLMREFPESCEHSVCEWAKETTPSNATMASRFSFYSFPGYQFLISTFKFLISTITFFTSIITFSLVKCHHRLPNQLLISRIDFLLLEMSILDIHNRIATSNNDHFWYQEFNCY